MFRDTYIKLILKELLNDPSLSNIIYQIVLDLEIIDSQNIHKRLSKNYKDGILLLYPKFLKTAIFENIQYNNQDEIDPGFTFYTVDPLISCGYNINWLITPPLKYISPQLLNPPKKSKRGIDIINKIQKKYSSEIILKLIKKRNRHHSYELHNEKYGIGKGLWYDFDNHIFINLKI